MQFILVAILVILGGFFVWQLALLIRDIIRKVKNKKNKDIAKDNNSAEDSAKNDDMKGE